MLVLRWAALATTASAAIEDSAAFWQNARVPEGQPLPCKAQLGPEDLLQPPLTSPGGAAAGLASTPPPSEGSVPANMSLALVDPSNRRALYHSTSSRMTRFSSGGGTANSDLKTSFTFGSSSYNPRYGAFTYTSQPVAIGTSVTITLAKGTGAPCDGWNGAYFTAWDQYLTLAPSDGCGPRSWTFTVGTFEQDTFAASQVWSTGVTNGAWTRRSGATPSSYTGPSSAADGVCHPIALLPSRMRALPLESYSSTHARMHACALAQLPHAAPLTPDAFSRAATVVLCPHRDQRGERGGPLRA